MNRPYKSTSDNDLVIICSNVPNRDVIKAILTELSHRETKQAKELEATLVQHLINQSGDGPVISLNPAARENQSNPINVYKSVDIANTTKADADDNYQWNTNPKPSSNPSAEAERKAVTELQSPEKQKPTAFVRDGQTSTIRQVTNARDHQKLKPTSNKAVAENRSIENNSKTAARHRLEKSHGGNVPPKVSPVKHSSGNSWFSRNQGFLRTTAYVFGLVIIGATIGYLYFSYNNRLQTAANLDGQQEVPEVGNEFQKGLVVTENVGIAQETHKGQEKVERLEFSKEIQTAPEVPKQPFFAQEIQNSAVETRQVPVVQDIQTGLDAYENGDYPTALREFQALSDQGNAMAQYNLGLLFDKGEGVLKDPGEAMKWFSRSAEQKNPDAQLMLGKKYYNGEDILEDHEEAAKWFRESATQGNADAQNRLGFMYEKGYGVVEDQSEAAKWYRKSAEQGNVNAQKNLSAKYYLGQGVNQDNTYAHMWASIAASQGHQTAVKVVDLVAKKMKASDISKAKELALECENKNYKGC